tara:strand:- start:15805 stop:16917 length:1113 start_codon:yes stop_codon:yes gene_type:complete
MGKKNNQKWSYIIRINGPASSDNEAVHQLTNRLKTKITKPLIIKDVRNSQGVYEIFVTESKIPTSKSELEQAVKSYGLVKSEKLRFIETLTNLEYVQRATIKQKEKNIQNLKNKNKGLNQDKAKLQQDKKELEDLLDECDKPQKIVNFNQAAKYIEDYATEVVARVENIRDYVQPFKEKFADEIKKNKENREMVEFYEAFKDEIPKSMKEETKIKYEKAKKAMSVFEETQTNYETRHTEAVAHLDRLNKDLDKIKSLQDMINQKINPQPQNILETKVEKDKETPNPTQKTYLFPLSERKAAEITSIRQYYLQHVRHLVKPEQRQTGKRKVFEYSAENIDYINKNRDTLMPIAKKKHAKKQQEYMAKRRKK